MESDKKLELVWSQEFDETAGTTPDSTFWNYDIGTGHDGWGNQEHEFYVDTQAVTDGNGNLIITADRITADRAHEFTDPRVEFVSSRLLTHKKVSFQYGRIEASIKTPLGQGTWPALWMLGNQFESIGWPQCGEIDILEVGDQKDLMHFTLHGPGYFGNDGLTKTHIDATHSLNEGFHEYAIEWLPGQIDWFFDGKHISRQTSADAQARGSEWVFDQEFFLITNLAMGGMFVPLGIDPSLNSAQLTIDYIRHYSIDGVGSARIHN